MTPKNMSMTDDIKALVERLRQFADDGFGLIVTGRRNLEREAADALTRLSAENERLREALLSRVQAENECPGSDRRTFPYEQCTGWNAEKCRCALQVRALASGEPAHKSGSATGVV